ncbi:MAG: DUF2855 family protein [Pseudomonadota bacterium]
MTVSAPGPLNLLLGIDRSDISRTTLPGDRDTVPATPAPGTVVLKTDSFALTANNITYAAFGDAMHYWSFFPHSSGLGVLPVWGFATVEASAHEEIGVGERIYGYLPSAETLIVTPAAVEAATFVDAAPHRAELPAIYNGYRRVSKEPGYDRANDTADMVLRPLYLTSFLIDDFLAAAGDFGAAQIVVSSASSKTALGVAFQVTRRAGDRPTLIGLTSAGNVDFVRSLGVYDEVLDYADIATGLTPERSVFVDIAGSTPVRTAVHQRLDELLRHSASVGASHWDELTPHGDLPGPEPTLFFAPAQFAARSQEIGSAALLGRFGESWAAFIRFAAGWMRESLLHTPGELAGCYVEFVRGNVDPKTAFIYKNS